MNESFTFNSPIVILLIIISPFLLVIGLIWRIKFWTWILNDDHYEVHTLAPQQVEDLSKRLSDPLFEELPTKEISTALLIPGSQDIIVMLKFITTFRNILRCTPDGLIRWQAELPVASNDVYTHIMWKENGLMAYSRSCITVTLDVNTGKIISPKESAIL